MRTSRRLGTLIAFLLLLLWGGGGAGCNCGQDACSSPGDHFCKTSYIPGTSELREIYERCKQGNCLPDGGSDNSCLYYNYIFCGSGVGSESCPDRVSLHKRLLRLSVAVSPSSGCSPFWSATAWVDSEPRRLGGLAGHPGGRAGAPGIGGGAAVTEADSRTSGHPSLNLYRDADPSVAILRLSAAIVLTAAAVNFGARLKSVQKDWPQLKPGKFGTCSQVLQALGVAGSQGMQTPLEQRSPLLQACPQLPQSVRS